MTAPEMLTAESITEDQIRELWSTCKPEDRYGGHTVAGTCREALGELHLHGSTQAGARRRCAELINMRRSAS